MMDLTQEQQDIIINAGVFGYKIEKISSILGIDQKILETTLNNDVQKLIKKGQDLSDYVIDLKLFEMAKSGDIKALDKIEQRKRLRK